MGMHHPLTSKTIVAKQNRYGIRVNLPPRVYQEAALLANLKAGENVKGNPEASEQLDILAAIRDGLIRPVTAHPEALK